MNLGNVEELAVRRRCADGKNVPLLVTRNGADFRLRLLTLLVVVVDRIDQRRQNLSRSQISRGYVKEPFVRSVSRIFNLFPFLYCQSQSVSLAFVKA